MKKDKSKKLNKNIFVFIIAFLIIGAGFFSQDYFVAMKDSFVEFYKNPKGDSPGDRVENLISSVESNSSDKIAYHNTCMDIYSLFLRETNSRVTKKGNYTIIKLNNGQLAFKHRFVIGKKAVKYADNIKELQDKTGIPVLYVFAPSKGKMEDYPASAEKFNNSFPRLDKFKEILKSRDINVLDLGEEMEKQGIKEEDAYFITDHHWTPKTGLWASEEICKRLNKDYGFQYDKDMYNLSNYNIKTYKNCFLGSIGKKIGGYYTSLGLDDFDIITPKFDTLFRMSLPKKKKSVTGSFEDTLLDKSDLNLNKSVYETNPYTVYSGGNHALQVINNKMVKDNGNNILMIRDSYACPVVPFFALSCSSLQAVDLRGMDSKRIDSVSELAKKNKNDYIVILYNEIQNDNCYDFR